MNMEYIITLIILLILLILLFKLFNKEILSPSIVYTISMIGCLICSMIGLINWNNVKELKFTTIAIIVLSDNKKNSKKKSKKI